MNINIYAVISLILKILGLLILIAYPIPKQFSEVLRPRSWLTPLRWKILLILIFSVVTEIPAVVTIILRIYGHFNIDLQNIASILGSLSGLAMSVLYVLLYSYKQKE